MESAAKRGKQWWAPGSRDRARILWCLSQAFMAKEASVGAPTGSPTSLAHLPLLKSWPGLQGGKFPQNSEGIELVLITRVKDCKKKGRPYTKSVQRVFVIPSTNTILHPNIFGINKLNALLHTGHNTRVLQRFTGS